MATIEQFAASRQARALVLAATPACCLTGWAVGGLTSALIYGIVGFNVTICAEILRRQVEKPIEAKIVEKEADIVDLYENAMKTSYQTCLYTWVGRYPDEDAEGALTKMKAWIERKVRDQPNFQMVRIYNPNSENWTPDKLRVHTNEMKDLMDSKNYLLIPGSFHGKYSEGFELGYSDYLDSDHQRQLRGSINFVQENGDPYVAMGLDSGNDARHEKPIKSIRRMFAAYLVDAGYQLEDDDRVVRRGESPSP